MSRFSWEHVRNPSNIPIFEDRFVSIEHGNPMDQLLEDVIEESTSTHSQVNENIHLTTNPVSESTEKTQTDFDGNLPTPRATPEVPIEQTISRETSHEITEESVENVSTPSPER
ncbi:hypothetical protein K3495_g16861, partial [Podosphaera aphanis]